MKNMEVDMGRRMKLRSDGRDRQAEKRKVLEELAEINRQRADSAKAAREVPDDIA